jgi:hypothetical protein
MRFAGIVSIACLVGQAAAYSNSPFKASDSMQCTVHPFGACETVMGAGYAALMGNYGTEYNLEAAIATFMPLMMWLTLILSAHAPKFTMRRGGKRSISPGGWMYMVLFLIVLAVSGMTIRQKDPPKQPGAPSTSLG